MYMHICHIVLDNVGGAPRVANSLVCLQVKSGYRVSVVSLKYLEQEWELFRSAHEILTLNTTLQLKAVVKLSKVIAKLNPDIIICHSAFIMKLTYLSRFVPGSLSIPYISYIHNDLISELYFKPKTDCLRGLVRNVSRNLVAHINWRALQQASGIIFVCQSLYEKYSKLGWNHHAIVSYNPLLLDTEDRPLHPTAELWLTNSSLMSFVSAARLESQKDHKTLLEAFAQASQTHSNIRLILLGDGPLKLEIQSLAASLGTSDKILFAGYVPNPSAYFLLSRAVILSSHFEGFGMVLVEAVASGVTFIASDCPTGPREISELLECGTLVPPGDADALAAAIVSHVETPKQIVNKYNLVDQLFSESSCAHKLNDLIQLILA